MFALGPSRPRKLLSIAHSYVLGVNRKLAHEFQRQSLGKWEVSVVAPAYFQGRNDIRPNSFRAEPDEPIHVDAIHARWTNRIHVFHYERKLREIIRSGFDLVHAWEEPYIAAGLQIARATPQNVPLVYRTAQSLDKRYPPPFNWMESYCTRRMSGWIYSGSLVGQNLKKRPGYADKPSCVAPLGFDPNRMFVDRAAGRATRRELGWDDSIPVVGYLGRFVKAKGLQVLMDAIDLLNVPVRVLMVGDGPMRQEVDAWMKTRGDSVRICSQVKHASIAPYINAMDVLLAPSLTTPQWKEQFGRMIVEAFACGVPVIGSDSGEIPYVIGDAGIVVPENQTQLLADAISELIDSPTRRGELAEKGLAVAHEKYTWARIARTTLDFFDTLV